MDSAPVLCPKQGRRRTLNKAARKHFLWEIAAIRAPHLTKMLGWLSAGDGLDAPNSKLIRACFINIFAG
jgi:hypothetical protein